MKDINLAVRIERKQWREFLKQSRKKGLTASERLRSLIGESLNSARKESGTNAFLQMGSIAEEGSGPEDLSARKDDYLYGRPASTLTRRKRNHRR